MSHHVLSAPTFGMASALVMVLNATSAAADVTAQQVWDALSDQMKVYGGGFTTGTITQSGDALTVPNVVIEMTNDDASVRSDLGDILLTETGNGSVDVTFPASYPMHLLITPPNEDPTEITATVRQSGSVLNVSGTPEEMLFDLRADRYAITVDSLTGAATQDVMLETAALVVSQIAGQYTQTAADLNTFTSTFEIGTIDLNVVLDEVVPSGIEPGGLTLTASIQDLAAVGNAALPLDLDLEGDMPPFDAGLFIEARYSTGPSRTNIDANFEQTPVSLSSALERAELSIAMDYDHFSYGGAAVGIDLSILSPTQLPLPIEAAIARYGFDFQMPLSQGDGTPQDAKLAFNITDLALSNEIWDLFDPARILTRDTVTVALDLGAKVTPFFDFLDPAQQEALALTDVPGELHAATLSDLTLRGAGAEVTGSGAFTFDNSDLESFGGVPRPEGKAEFALNGINGLVDALIQMGIIPEQDALMPRMMLGMFATPVGEDMLTSTIEVNAEGHVLANGQRLR